jgi:hypothetical protein
MFSRATIDKVSRIAKSIGVEPAELLAVAEVESGGVVSWNTRRGVKPPIRFEGHYFYKRLKGEKLKAAIKAGLANPKAGAVANRSSYDARYDMLDAAMKIDAMAAQESTSWGLGQVMGAHWKKLGYSSVRALVEEACSGVDGQISLMVKYIEKFGLVDELQTKNDKSFADQYNGPASAKNRYAQKIAAARKRYEAILAQGPGEVIAEPEAGLLQAQKDLKRLGFYKGSLDGKNGPSTKAAIKAFQKSQGLVADGKYGKLTDEALDAEIARKDVVFADNAVATGSSGTGVSVVTDVIRDQTSSLESVSYYTSSDIVTYLILTLMVAGMLLTVYGLYIKFKNKDV